MSLLPELIERKIKWYYWNSMIAKGFATIHLISSGKGFGPGSDEFNYGTPTIQQLEKLYPGISKSLQREEI